jgi:hypothetical protein
MVGVIVVWLFPSRTATWISMLFLLAIHLLMNHAAVRAVKMRSLNRQRANILFSNLVEHNRVLTPQDVSEREQIFERRGGGVFRWDSDAVLGYCNFGVSLQNLLRSLPQSRQDETTRSLRLGTVDLSALTQLFRNQQYILWCQTATPRWYDAPGPQLKVLVVLKQGVSPESQLRAWYHALLLARRISLQSRGSNSAVALEPLPKEMLFHVASTLELATTTFDSYARRLRAVGWELDIPVLETRSGSRIFCETKKGYAHF